MALAPPFDPLRPVACNACDWQGKAGDCDPKPDDYVRCPRCNHAVEWADGVDTPVSVAFNSNRAAFREAE